jgi:MFS family permease
VALVYPSQLMGRAFAANSHVWGVMGFAGPALAAALLQVGSWRWIFLVMVPIAAAALVAGWRTLPGPVEPGALRVDWIEVGLLVVAVGSLLATVSYLSAAAWLPALVMVISGALLWRRMTRNGSSLLDRRFIGDYPYRQLAAVTALTLVAIIGLSSYLPVYVRGARGATVAAAAWSVLWLTLGWTVAANVAGRVTDRVDERSVMRAGAFIGIPAIAAAWAAVAFAAPLPAVYATYFAMGAAVGVVTNAALQMVRLAVPSTLAGRATSAHAFSRTVGMSVGAGLAGGVILATVARAVGDVSPVRDALAGDTSSLAGAAVTALASGVSVAHGVSFGIMVLTLLPLHRLMTGPPLTGDQGN